MSSYRETIFRIKRENGALETSLREADVFFSAGEKRAEKRVCSPQANWKRVVINFVPAKRSSRGSYIKTRNLIPCLVLCLCCSFVIGLPVAKNSEATSKKDEMANGSARRHCVTHSSSSGPIF